MVRIEVNDIKLYAYHGCLPEEALIGGNYIVHVAVDADADNSMAVDELSQTVDYVMINEVVKEEMAIRSKLIEHVAGRILKRIVQNDRRVSKCKVRIRKLSPPINGNVEEVAVEVSSGKDA